MPSPCTRRDHDGDIHRAARAKKVQLAFRYELTRAADGAPVASGFTVHGCLDAAGRPVRVPEQIERLAAAGHAG